jgi:hypothetical protein
MKITITTVTWTNGPERSGQQEHGVFAWPLIRDSAQNTAAPSVAVGQIRVLVVVVEGVDLGPRGHNGVDPIQQVPVELGPVGGEVDVEDPGPGARPPDRRPGKIAAWNV